MRALDGSAVYIYKSPQAERGRGHRHDDTDRHGSDAKTPTHPHAAMAPGPARPRRPTPGPPPTAPGTCAWPWARGGKSDPVTSRSMAVSSMAASAITHANTWPRRRFLQICFQICLRPQRPKIWEKFACDAPDLGRNLPVMPWRVPPPGILVGRTVSQSVGVQT